MDTLLLTLLNQTLAHPLLDSLMVAITRGGLALLPLTGLALLTLPRHRPVGVAVLASLLAGLSFALLYEYLALRPRPTDVRLIIEQSNFPSYPSGHATAAFCVAWVLLLAYRRRIWQIGFVVGASLIAVSRVYLGQHYPSDIIGGALLGTAVGAAAYGLIVAQQPWRLRLSWLLWVQVAIALIVTQMAYLDILPDYLLLWPFADKVLHFLLIGSIAFWLNLWLNGRGIYVGTWLIPLALLIPFSLATLEEGIQFFSPLRTADLVDLSSDLVGLLFFWWLSQKVIRQGQLHIPTHQST